MFVVYDTNWKMDLALRQKDIDFIPEYITEFELKEFVEVVQTHMSCTSFGSLILKSCKKTKNGYRPSKDLKTKIDKFVRSFPEAELAQEGLECEARSEYDYNESCIKKGLPFANTNMFKGPSNEEIKKLWKKKREEKRIQQESITSVSICLKRKGLPAEVVNEHITKQMRYK